MECILSRVAVWHAATMLLLTFCALFSSEMVSPKLGIWHRLSIWTSLEIRNKCNDCALLMPCISLALFMELNLFSPHKNSNPGCAGCATFALNLLAPFQRKSLVCIFCCRLCGSPLFHKSLEQFVALTNEICACVFWKVQWVLEELLQPLVNLHSYHVPAPAPEEEVMAFLGVFWTFSVRVPFG